MGTVDVTPVVGWRGQLRQAPGTWTFKPELSQIHVVLPLPEAKSPVMVKTRSGCAPVPCVVIVNTQ